MKTQSVTFIGNPYPFALILSLLLPWQVSTAAIDIIFDVSTDTNTPEAAVATGIADLCPRLQDLPDPSPQTQRLIEVCTAVTSASATETEAAYEALSARAATSVVTLASIGLMAQPIDLVNRRLAALRRAAANASNAALQLEINGQPLSAADVLAFNLSGTGGGASADSPGSPLSGFVTGIFSDSQQTQTTTLAGFQGNTNALMLGMDYRYTSNIYAGVAGRFSQTDVQLDKGAGTLKADDFNVTVYATQWIYKNLYLDATLHRSRGNFDISRKIKFDVGGVDVDETASGSTHGNQVGLSLGGGYELVLRNSIVTQITGNLRLTKTDIDGYEETGANGLNLRIKEQSIDSRVFKLGALVSYAISYPWGVLSPQLDVNWIHQFKTEGQRVHASFVSDPYNTSFVFTTEERDSDYFTLNLGAMALLPGGLTAYFQYETYLGYSNYEQSMWSLGARMEF